jgi:ribosomal protein S18 acetylase RimI-like enzyme
MADDLRIEPLDPSDIDLLAPLWRALLDHVSGLPGALVPIRPFEQSWPLERAEIAEALTGDAFILVALRGDEAMGYAWVNIEGPDPVWYTGETRAELVHLGVIEGRRGGGIGSALMDAVDAELLRRGVEDVEIGVDTANHEAVRFYEERGYRPDFHILYGSPGKKPWACLRRAAEDEAAGRGRFEPPGPDEQRA